jgi:predicted helicase
LSIQGVLEEIRRGALDLRNQGDRFERLVQRVLQEAEIYTQQYDEVWLWKDWPGRDGRPDTGIDLVARQRDGGGLTAIQCKFYESGHLVSKADIDSFLSASGKEGFTERVIVSTTGWGKNAEEAIHGQAVPVQRLDVNFFDDLGLVWAGPMPDKVERRPRNTLRPHQREALTDILGGLAKGDRGQLIMACGTGKTFTSLKIAEEYVGAGGRVLFLVPSISLLSQTLTEWSRESETPLRPFAVCSDVKVGRRNVEEDMSAVDLPEPATTSGAKLLERMARSEERASDTMTVVFSTYQSLQAVHEAQGLGLGDFDLVICDEAHRTTGVTLATDDDPSAFVRIHDAAYVRAGKRVYMTATPRLYDDASKARAGQADAVLASMDDETTFGPVWHRLGFGDAVERDLLSDYKVLVLAVDEATVAERFQQQWASGDVELGLDDTARLVGCWNGLAKENLPELGAAPMRRAVAFAGTIKISQQVAGMFEQVAKECATRAEEKRPDGPDAMRVESRHVDGTFNVLERNKLLAWLKEPMADGDNVCRVLSNARCLSEGVDVPDLDSVLFLNPRKSVVDVVQSVGRVMRKAPGKEFGYVILPIAIPAGVPPEQALNDNKRYAVVWQVLQALRAHDDRFNAEVNKIDLNKKSDRIIAVGVPSDTERDSDVDPELPLNWGNELRTAIYARMVQKVGQRTYWEDWAKDIADIARRHETRIKTLLDNPDLEIGPFFDRFLAGLKANLNDAISRDNAVEMLAQHIITKPVFDALFSPEDTGYDFTAHNPVSLVMQDMLEVLDEQGIDTEVETLDRFYASVANRAKGIETAEGKQRIITQLYEKFFKNAFPKAAESLGIVYTPVEIVDFILRSVEDLLRSEFGASLNDEGVHVLDPFTGTGTFIVRLLQSGLITPENLLRKYTSELHANEINLLAYYVAAVNIEATFHGLVGGEYRPFDGIVLVDTFQMTETDDTLDREIFVNNNARVERQLATPIRVIVGNPPYSAGQTSANDDNANLKYPTLDRRIEETYAARSTSGLKKALYDSYIRAIRWASDRIGEQGIVGFVSNGGFIDSNTADGLRQCLLEEFDAVYVYNLRGNQRTAGEQSRREGGKVFGGGSRATIAITFLVKKPPSSSVDLVATPTFRYRDIGDYLSREQKLAIVDGAAIGTVDWQAITPNDHGDWINQRRLDFESFDPVGDKGAQGIFGLYSYGVVTNRDSWVCGSSSSATLQHVKSLVAEYERQRAARAKEPERDPEKIAWTRSLISDFSRDRELAYREGALVDSVYRPFFRQHLYFDRRLNEQVQSMFRIFPTRSTENIAIYNVGLTSEVPFSALAVNHLPDLHLTGAGSGGHAFPRWRWEPMGEETLDFGGDEADMVDGYRRVDNITDTALGDFCEKYPDLDELVKHDPTAAKDEIFYYVYGLLHSPTYRSEFAADLKKMLPRIPKVRDFRGYAEAGRRLADLHIRYESAAPYPLQEVVSATLPDEYEQFAVTDKKMAHPKVRVDGKLLPDRTQIQYNPRILLTGIPEEAYRYQLGSRSAIEWIIDRYYIRTDKASGIINDPNDWSREHEQPRYIIDLIKRIVTVSLETMQIVDVLPALDILEEQ